MGLPKLALAADRKRFKGPVEEYVTGAFGEYAKAEVGRANGYSDWQTPSHWLEEVSKLLDERHYETVRYK